MFSETIESADLIGARVDGPSGGAGFVAAVREPEGVIYTLAGGMRRNRAEHQIIWDSGRVEWLPDGITAPMIARARRLAPVPRDEIPARLAAAEAAEAAARERTLAARIGAGEQEGRAIDCNGNTCGRFSIGEEVARAAIAKAEGRAP